MPPRARPYSVKRMANDLTPDNTPTKPIRRRLSPKVRHAIDLYVTKGMSKAEAAREAGISEGHLYNYLMKEHAKAYEVEAKSQYLQDVESMKIPYKAQAFEVARDLMHNAKSESVRMRAVEFFAGERKGNAVNVAVSVNNHAASGYDYVPPGAQVIDITPQQPDNDSTPDSPSSGEGDEAP